ncbi:MAG: SEC-C domain-containing protein [Bacteroidales bacterium]|nr:SEC-C domain-containing protein [Bacteroidales bacterium]
MLLTVEVRTERPPEREQVAKPTGEGAVADRASRGGKGQAPVRVQKIGRNDPCPCGSGLKWKKCTCAQYHPQD